MSQLHADPVPPRLTPSETVLLHGDRFAGEAGMLRGRTELLTAARKVSTDELAEAALAAMVLGSERAGAVRLEVRARKVLFGLMSRQTLYAEAVGGAGDAPPEGTLEAQFRARLGAGPKEVGEAIYEMLERDTHSPAEDVLDRVRTGLFGRGLLERDEVKKLKFFTTHVYRLAAGTPELLREQPADPVRRLLDECERSRPEVWKLLGKHVGGALARRTEQSDAGGPD